MCFKIKSYTSIIAFKVLAHCMRIDINIAELAMSPGIDWMCHCIYHTIVSWTFRDISASSPRGRLSSPTYNERNWYIIWGQTKIQHTAAIARATWSTDIASEKLIAHATAWAHGPVFYGFSKTIATCVACMTCLSSKIGKWSWAAIAIWHRWRWVSPKQHNRHSIPEELQIDLLRVP